MVHSSVKSLGWVVGGPDIIIDAILEVIGSNGTLTMFASWEDNPYDLERWDNDKRAAYLKECPAYDLFKSRSDRKEMGILTEYLRTRVGACRSRHPFSYIAIGKHSQHITENHPWNYRDGKNSPLSKLCDLEGKVLLLGAPLSSVSLLHHAEALASVPNKKTDHYKMPVLIDGQTQWMEFEEYDTTNGIIDWPDDYFITIMNEFISTNHIEKKQVGNGPSYLFEAKPVLKFGIEWMEKNFNLKKD